MTKAEHDKQRTLVIASGLGQYRDVYPVRHVFQAPAVREINPPQPRAIPGAPRAA